MSLDDFRQGYSSLSYLKRFKNKIDTLKVDRQFIQDITSSSEDALIAETIYQLAHQMKLKVVAEGVETREQLIVLSKFKYDQIQGYLFSKPLPILEFESILDKGKIDIRMTEENIMNYQTEENISVFHFHTLYAPR
ncbi:EAL domain-containing protein [Bacillus sp. C11]|nr:EAL domain-containing protein [Neobacillus terrae]